MALSSYRAAPDRKCQCRSNRDSQLSPPLYSYGVYSYVVYSHGVYSYGVYSYGLYSYGLYSYDLYIYGPCSHGPSNQDSQLSPPLYSYGLCSYGRSNRDSQLSASRGHGACAASTRGCADSRTRETTRDHAAAASAARASLCSVILRSTYASVACSVPTYAGMIYRVMACPLSLWPM